MRVIFMGSPEFAVPFIEILYNKQYNIVGVFSAPLAIRSKRGKQTEHCNVAKFAIKNELPLFTPKTLKDTNIQQQIAALNPDIIIVVAYGAILPKSILDIPKYGCINVHASILPKWRGAAPIERAIEAGDKETGVAIMKMEAGLDTGPVALIKNIAIENLNSLQVRHVLAKIGGPLLLEALEKLKNNELIFTPQIGEPTYAHKITKEEAKLDWQMKAEELERKIRAFTQNPGAWCEMKLAQQNQDKSQIFRVKIFAATVSNEPSHLSKKCGDNQYLNITLCQKAGGKILTGEQFKAGYYNIEFL